MYAIESLLAAHLYLSPQVAGERIYFISNKDGHLSLYGMDLDGGNLAQLLPPQIALQNPILLEGTHPFYVFPALGQILVMIDQDGDENYQPMLIPLSGGQPQPAFGQALAGTRVHMQKADPAANIVYLNAEQHDEPLVRAYQGNLRTGELTLMGESAWGLWVSGASPDHQRTILVDGYTTGDHVVYLWERGQSGLRLLFGVPAEQRQPGQPQPLNAITAVEFTPSGQGLIFITALHEDTFSVGYLPLNRPTPGTAADDVLNIPVANLTHRGRGELVHLEHLWKNHYLLIYNVEGVSWAYEALFDESALALDVHRLIVGLGRLSNGTLQAIFFDRDENRYALSFSTATFPTTLYTLEGVDRQYIRHRTPEGLENIPADRLSPGEDASYISFDGMPVSARLYLPAPTLGFEGPRPVVLYIHGGPQGQERPDFAWFSMPLIQFLTINGFAVFVPNVRGSTGYGLAYTKLVDHDWGGNDRLDHVHAVTQVLSKDERLDTSRTAVMGRSYGGYMTLTLVGRHPELWKAAVDMFGPYDLLTFMERIPETWKPYFVIALGDPKQDRDFLVERSPRTHIDNLACPLLVIQGKNDPRVVEAESHDLVKHLQKAGKQVEYLVFENEGHDVLKFENRVLAFNTITRFFKQHLNP